MISARKQAAKTMHHHRVYKTLILWLLLFIYCQKLLCRIYIYIWYEYIQAGIQWKLVSIWVQVGLAEFAIYKPVGSFHSILAWNSYVFENISCSYLFLIYLFMDPLNQSQSQLSALLSNSWGKQRRRFIS